MTHKVDRVPGIYTITNLQTNRVYVGQSGNLGHRVKAHFSELHRNVHFNSWLQASFNKRGEKEFVFRRVVVCDPSALDMYEQSILNYYKTLPGGVYNNPGPIRSPARGRVVSAETRAKLSKALTGRVGHVPSDATRKKLSDANKLAWETREDVPYWTGKALSDDHKLALSESIKLSFKAPENLEKMRISRLSCVRPVESLNPKTGEIKSYISASEGAAAHGISPQVVSRAARGQVKSCHQLLWRYCDGPTFSVDVIEKHERIVEALNIRTGESITYRSASAAAKLLGLNRRSVAAACAVNREYRSFLWRFID